MEKSEQPVLVTGAGVQGLTVGVVLAEAGVPVRIRTQDRPSETTSAVAGAMWGPALLNPAERVQHWCARSHAEFVALADDERTGVHLTPGRVATRVDMGRNLPPEVRLIPDLRGCTEAELPPGFVAGFHGTMPLIDMPRYLDHLVDRFLGAGGELLISPVPTLQDAVSEADTVVNCTGVRAHELIGDPEVHPGWGQHVVVRDPGIEEYFVELGPSTEWAGWVPHGDHVVLGGVAREHEWNRQPSQEVTAGILRRCGEIEPRLRGAEVVDVTVGLRPQRREVRLEVEHFRGARVLHDYGHGGSGVALSWGCAYEIAELV